MGRTRALPHFERGGPDHRDVVRNLQSIEANELTRDRKSNQASDDHARNTLRPVVRVLGGLPEQTHEADDAATAKCNQEPEPHQTRRCCHVEPQAVRFAAFREPPHVERRFIGPDAGTAMLGDGAEAPPTLGQAIIG